ncbi:hypothetical protein BBP40_001196 [Aspergillus hancockii]|nr:hypothetical protein BBP40_001196 [Aspergillus hancockii]
MSEGILEGGNRQFPSAKLTIKSDYEDFMQKSPPQLTYLRDGPINKNKNKILTIPSTSTSQRYSTPWDPILIVGAGIVGLTLGQALKKVFPPKGIPFEIYERDPTPDARGQGWAITLHWALEYLHQILPTNVLTQIQDIQVDPDVAHKDNGYFPFVNLATGEPRFEIPPSERWRVNREKMRNALLHGIEDRVHWDRRAKDVDLEYDSEKVRLMFDDGSSITGRMVVGVEGSGQRLDKR